jgi:hypothetical protein
MNGSLLVRLLPTSNNRWRVVTCLAIFVPRDLWDDGVMRGLIGAAGPGRNGGPAASVRRGRPAPQLHR